MRFMRCAQRLHVGCMLVHEHLDPTVAFAPSTHRAARSTLLSPSRQLAARTALSQELLHIGCQLCVEPLRVQILGFEVSNTIFEGAGELFQVFRTIL